MEVKLWSYQDIPEFTDDVPGAHHIKTTGNERGVRYYHDIEYAEVDGHKLHLQILIPATRNCPRMPKFPPMPGFEDIEFPPSTASQPETPLPCVVFVQGSAWMQQDCYGNVPNAAKLAELGYIVAIVEYRHSFIAKFPSQAIDAGNAIRFLKKNADMFYIDPEKMVVAGDSSGGHTALWCQMLKNDNTPTNLFPGISADVCGIINQYGSVSTVDPDSNPTTTNHNKADSPEGFVMGHVDLTENPELIKQLAVECNITKDLAMPPVLIFHGTKDRTVNTRQSATLFKTLRECGKDAELYFVDGGDHGGSEFWTGEPLRIMDEFIKKVTQ